MRTRQSAILQRSGLAISLATLIFLGACGKKVAPPPPPPPPEATLPTASLSANPNTVDPGQPTTLTWQTTGATEVTIEGHSDERGSTEYNLALGTNRADAVKSALIQAGIAGNRIKTISYGKEKLLDSSEADSADGKNRRANFVVQNK